MYLAVALAVTGYSRWSTGETIQWFGFSEGVMRLNLLHQWGWRGYPREDLYMVRFSCIREG